MSKYVLLLLLLLTGSIGQIILKLGVNQSISQIQEFNSIASLFKNILILLKSYWIISAIFLYAFGFIIWLFTLTKFELSYAFPLLAATYIVIMLFSWFFLKEDINTLRIIGTIAITIGIFLIAKS
ncbi:EamA family transporter [Patescibacteria group bacterium]|nr:EamA family transporter [Patescibacteria group bacterium]